jgi:hypothetical protein
MRVKRAYFLHDTKMDMLNDYHVKTSRQNQVPTEETVPAKYSVVLDAVKILLVRVKKPRSSYTGFS